ncbi:hypothetical protein PG5_00210 [Pseudomonas sp. G5(2012)]|nr:hypothetical protein PG5_00210 [Pseudomonas sp. G5(2012)]
MERDIKAKYIIQTGSLKDMSCVFAKRRLGLLPSNLIWMGFV